PSGKSRTGRRIPKTPGSILAGDVTIRVFAEFPVASNGSAFRTTRAICSHRRDHMSNTATAPMNHADAKMKWKEWASTGVTVAAGCSETETGDTPNGWLICRTTTGTSIGATDRTGCHCNIPPNPTKSENGRRNFTDAISHNRYRTTALF